MTRPAEPAAAARRLSHDLAKGPGQYRTGPIYVHDDRTGATVCEGADAGSVPSLMDEFVDQLRGETPVDPLIRGAMAHLNLLMIHPFRDGNGRMGRALQTLVLPRGGIAEPTFSSIEEWLGSNTDDYYRVLAITGGGAWNPGNAAGSWVKFNLRAHHMQAQTLRRRFDDAGTARRGTDADLQPSAAINDHRPSSGVCAWSTGNLGGQTCWSAARQQHALKTATPVPNPLTR